MPTEVGDLFGISKDEDGDTQQGEETKDDDAAAEEGMFDGVGRFGDGLMGGGMGGLFASSGDASREEQAAG